MEGIRKAFARPQNDTGQWSVREETIGPKEDPYGRTTFRYGDVTLVECGLAGTNLDVAGEVIVEFAEGEEAARARRMFKVLTGHSIRELLEWHEKQYAEDDDVRDAERAAGWIMDEDVP